MKAILIVHKKSRWAEKNYLTFDVIRVVNIDSIVLDIDNAEVKVSHREVVIVDLQAETLKAYEKDDEPLLFNFLNNYAHHKGQSFEVIQIVRINGESKTITHPI